MKSGWEEGPQLMSPCFTYSFLLLPIPVDGWVFPIWQLLPLSISHSNSGCWVARKGFPVPPWRDHAKSSMTRRELIISREVPKKQTHYTFQPLAPPLCLDIAILMWEATINHRPLCQSHTCVTVCASQEKVILNKLYLLSLWNCKTLTIIILTTSKSPIPAQSGADGFAPETSTFKEVKTWIELNWNI